MSRRHSVIEKQRRTGKPFSEVIGVLETNKYDPHRDVACAELSVPYGKVGVGGEARRVRRADGELVTIGDQIPGLTSYEILPGGRHDALLPKEPDAIERHQRHLDRIQSDGEYAMRVALEKWADDVDDGLTHPNEL